MKRLCYCFFVSILFTAFSAVAQTAEIDSLKALLKSLPKDTNRVKALLALSHEEFYFNVEGTLQPANEALALSEEIQYDLGKVKAFRELGIYYYHKGDITRASDCFLKALRISETMNDSMQIARFNNSIGVLYQDQKQYEEARRYYAKALNIYKSRRDRPGVSMMLSNIADIYVKQQNDSLALINYKQALEYCDEDCDETILCNIFNSMGDLYLRAGAYSESLDYQERALQLALKSRYLVWIQIVYGSLSRVHAARGLSYKALAAADSAMKYAQQIKSRRFVANSYAYLQEAYEKLDDYAMAYQYQSMHIALMDSLKNEENLNIVEKMRRQYEVEKKEMEMDLLAYQYETRIYRRNTFIVALAGILLLLIFIYIRYKERAKRQLAEKRTQLRHYAQSLVEKSEIISKINSDLTKLKDSSPAEADNIEKFSQILTLNIHTEENWGRFKELFDEVYPNFFSTLLYKYPDITPSELRLSAIIKLNLSMKDAAAMMGISPASVKQGRYRLKKKFDLKESSALEEFILNVG